MGAHTPYPTFQYTTRQPHDCIAPTYRERCGACYGEAPITGETPGTRGAAAQSQGPAANPFSGAARRDRTCRPPPHPPLPSLFTSCQCAPRRCALAAEHRSDGCVRRVRGCDAVFHRGVREAVGADGGAPSSPPPPTPTTTATAIVRTLYANDTKMAERTLCTIASSADSPMREQPTAGARRAKGK